MKIYIFTILLLTAGVALAESEPSKSDSIPLWITAVGLLAAGFFGKAGEKLLELIISRLKPAQDTLIDARSSAESLTVGVYALIKIAMWYAIFGVLSSAAFGIAGAIDYSNITKILHSVGNSSNLLANLVALFIAISTLQQYQQRNS